MEQHQQQRREREDGPMSQMFDRFSRRLPETAAGEHPQAGILVKKEALYLIESEVFPIPSDVFSVLGYCIRHGPDMSALGAALSIIQIFLPHRDFKARLSELYDVNVIKYRQGRAAEGEDEAIAEGFDRVALINLILDKNYAELINEMEPFSRITLNTLASIACLYCLAITKQPNNYHAQWTQRRITAYMAQCPENTRQIVEAFQLKVETHSMLYKLFSISGIRLLVFNSLVANAKKVVQTPVENIIESTLQLMRFSGMSHILLIHNFLIIPVHPCLFDSMVADELDNYHKLMIKIREDEVGFPFWKITKPISELSLTHRNRYKVLTVMAREVGKNTSPQLAQYAQQLTLRGKEQEFVERYTNKEKLNPGPMLNPDAGRLLGVDANITTRVLHILGATPEGMLNF